MAVDRAALIARFPEFTSAPTGLVDGAIADATLQVDATVFGALTDTAVMYFAAHLIATNPLGEMARLDKRSDKTTYLVAFERIKRGKAIGCLVV